MPIYDELDGCENVNGRQRLKESMNDIGLQIMNGVWDGMNEATWYTELKKFTLGNVCMDGRGMKKVVRVSIFDRVIESDNAAIRVEIECKW